MKRFDIEAVRKVLGNDAAEKLIASRQKIATPPITTESLQSLERYTKWLGSDGLEPRYYATDLRLADRKSFIVLVEQLVATKPTMRLVIQEFLKTYLALQLKDRVHLAGAYMFCTEGCGKKFLPSGMDIHLGRGHGIRHANTQKRLADQLRESGG